MFCRECKSSEKPFKINPGHKNSGICKPCHSKYNRNLQKRKAAKARPWAWFNCDDCDEIFSIKDQRNKPRTCCMYCQSEEIQTFEEQSGIKRASR